MSDRLRYSPAVKRLPLATVASIVSVARHAMALLVVTVVAIAALAGDADAARPGGGGSYSGGGRSSGGGGGGSSGGSSRGAGGGGSRSGGGYSSGYGGGYSSGGGYSRGTSLSGFEVVVLLVIAGVVVALVVTRRTRGAVAHDGRVRDAILRGQEAAVARAASSASLDALIAADPRLTLDAILGRVSVMSTALREAWCNGDMRPARPFVSDGIFSRYCVQLGLMRAEGLRNVMSDASILYMTLEAVESSPPLDAVHVRFTAQARDRMVPVGATPEQIAGALRGAPLEPYTEIWSLVRRQGATTKLDPAQVGHACPSCGAPLDGGEMIRCRYCSALVCSGEHDWVLAEITQLEEWHPSSAAVPGLAELRADDPGVAREVLEDRASYLFWKWIEAGRRQSAQPLRKCASPDFIATRAHAEGLANLRDVAVGAAELVLCDPGPDDGLDHAYVKVFWSAVFGTGPSAPVQSMLRLARRSGVLSQPSMTALSCTSCGAPVGESDTTTCDHCGAVLSAGDQAWVLDALEPAGSITPRNVARAALPDWMVPNVTDPRERLVLFAQMAALMVADGAIAPRERRLLRMCARRWSIPEASVDAMLRSPPVMRGEPVATASPEWFLAGLVAAALADGKIDPAEKALLDRACAALRLPPDAVARQLAAYTQRLDAAKGAAV
jgi:hypothetical protein